MQALIRKSRFTKGHWIVDLNPIVLGTVYLSKNGEIKYHGQNGYQGINDPDIQYNSEREAVQTLKKYYNTELENKIFNAERK